MSKDEKLNITKVYTQIIKGSGKKVTIKEFTCCDKPGAISNKDPKKVRK